MVVEVECPEIGDYLGLGPTASVMLPERKLRAGLAIAVFTVMVGIANRSAAAHYGNSAGSEITTRATS